MPYVGKKPADIIATSVDTDTGAFSGNVTAGGTLGVTGAVTANAGVVVDNITIDGTEIDLSSGDLTVDVAGVINLDADGAEVAFKDGGTHIGSIINNSSDFVFRSIVQDKDVLIRGNDGGSAITALQLDMSEAGQAIFNQRGRFNGATQEGILTVASNTTSNLGSTNAQITLQNTNQTNNSKGLVTFKTASDAGNGYHGVAFGGISTNSSDSSRQTAFSVYVADADNVDLSADERLRIHNNGVASFNNGIALGVGVNNTASNVLDDYEEGTWTPVLNRETSSPTISYSSRPASYVKIGNMVYCQAEINVSSISANGSGLNRITGLPFTAATASGGGGGGRWGGFIGHNTVLSGGNAFYIISNSTGGYFANLSNGTNPNTNYSTGILYIVFVFKSV